MDSKRLIQVGDDLNKAFDGLGLKMKPDVFLVVSEEEFKDIDWKTYYELHHTGEGFIPSENEIQLSFVNSTIHIFYAEEEKDRVQADRKPEVKKGRLSLLSRLKMRKQKG